MSLRARPKPQLSCDLCRRKKLRCDRQRPCSYCAKDSSRTCHYPKNNIASSSRIKSNSVDDRVEALEKRLHTLINGIDQGSQPSVPAAPSLITAPTPQAMPHLSMDGQQRYIDPVHWEGILHDIADIRLELQAATPESLTDRLQLSHAADGTACPRLLYGGSHDVSPDELLNPLLTPSLVELLLSIFLNHNRLTLLVILHVPSFRDSLRMFWRDPVTVDLAWLSMLYSVLSMGADTAHREGIEIPGIAHPDRMSYTYLHRAAQCLRDSEYGRPNKHTVPAMILYMASEHSWSMENAFQITIVVGIAVRLAMQQGYHRDPKTYDNISVFDGEMQRRVWSFLVQFDHLIARKAGMPRLIDERKVDTALPRNLHDEDIGPFMERLPEERPVDQPTNVAACNHKTNLLGILSKIMDESSASWQRVLELDALLMTAADNRPGWLTLLDEASLQGLSPFQINQIIEMDIIVQTSMMALHRRFLIAAHTAERYRYARQQCLEAAERTLYLQYLVTTQSAEQGPVSNWRFISLVNHDFLIAAMLLCLDLKHLLQIKSPLLGDKRFEEQIRLLRRAQQMWTMLDQAQHMPKKAFAIIDILIRRFEATWEAITSDEQFAAFDALSLQGPSLTDPALLPYSAYDGSSVDIGWSVGGLESSDMLIQSMLEGSNIDIDWTDLGM